MSVPFVWMPLRGYLERASEAKGQVVAVSSARVGVLKVLVAATELQAHLRVQLVVQPEPCAADRR